MLDVLIHNDNITIPIAQGISSGSITEGVNEFSSLTVTMLSSCLAYGLIQPYKTKFEVLENGGQKFYGRVLTETPSMSSSGFCSKKIVCEDRMAYLCDTVQPYTEERNYEGDDTRNGLQEFIDIVLDNHNSQVEDYKKIYRGNVTVKTHETTEGVYKKLNYESTWQILKEKLIDVYGGEMRVRETDGILYLDYAEQLGVTRSTKIEVGQNMQSAERTLDPTSVVSRLIPLGAKLIKTVVDTEGNESEQETEERLTIAEINGGISYVESETALQLYGVQYKTVVWDDIHDAQILRTRAIQYLAEQNTAIATHNVAAVDLSKLGIPADEIKLFDRYPVYNPYIGFDDTLEVVKKTTDIFNPAVPTFTLGNKNIYLSDISADNENKADNALQTVESIKTQTHNQVNNIYTFINTTTTEIQQSTNNILAQVTENTVSKSEYETFSETVRNILQMDANGTSMMFQTIIEEIKRVDGVQQSNYLEILKYIRFEDGNIILGEVNNPIILTLENDILHFKQNGVTVAYFANNRFYVSDGEFTNSLRIGKFAFVPRKNGNLSFKKVGGKDGAASEITIVGEDL